MSESRPPPPSNGILPKPAFVTSLFGALCLVWIGLATSDLHRRAFEYGGINLDPIAYRYQVETFARGRLWNPSPPLHEFFPSWGILDDGTKAYSKYFPGHAAVLLLFSKADGSQRWAVLFLTMLVATFVALNAGLLSGHRAMMWSLALLAASPFFLTTSATLLSHVTCLGAHAVACAALLQSRRWTSGSGRIGLAFVGGLAGGLAFLTRPLTAFAILVPGALLLMGDVARKRPGAVPRLVACAVALGLSASAQLAYNAELTGNALLSPFAQYWPPDRLGFGEWRGQGPAVGTWEGPFVEAHTIWRALRILGSNLAMLDRWLLGFQGSGLLLCSMIALGLRKTGSATERGFFVGVLVLQPLLYMLLWFEGLNHTGPIYYFEMLLPLCALGGWGLAELARGPGKSLAAGLALLAALLIGWRLRVETAIAPLELVTLNQQRDVAQIQRTIRPPALVFLPETRLGKPLSALVNGPAPLEQSITYAVDRGKDNARLLELAPEREAWRLVLLPSEPRPIGWRIELVKLSASRNETPP